MALYSTPDATPQDYSANAPESLPNILSARDRCDASQSEQAMHLYVRPNGDTLQFCDHHSREYASKLEMLGFTAL